MTDKPKAENDNPSAPRSDLPIVLRKALDEWIAKNRPGFDADRRSASMMAGLAVTVGMLFLEMPPGTRAGRLVTFMQSVSAMALADAMVGISDACGGDAAEAPPTAPGTKH